MEVELAAEGAQVARALAELDAATGEDAIARQVRILLRVGLAFFGGWTSNCIHWEGAGRQAHSTHREAAG